MTDRLISFWANHSDFLISVAQKLLITIALLIITPIVAGMVRKAIVKATNKVKKIDQNIVPILSTLASYIIYAVVAVMIFDMFGVNTASLIAVMGTVGLAIGLALKDTLGQVAAGFMLLIQRNFSVGDYIECGSISGTVTEVNLFVTKLKTSDGIFVAVPNNNLWGGNIINYSFHKLRRVTIKISASYSDSIDLALKTLMKLEEDERFLHKPSPQVALCSLGDNGVELMFRGWVKSCDYWQALWDNNKRAKELFEEAGLTIPFSQLDVHLSQEVAQ